MSYVNKVMYLTEENGVTTPIPEHIKIYVKADKNLYWIDDTGTERIVKEVYRRGLSTEKFLMHHFNVLGYNMPFTYTNTGNTPSRIATAYPTENGVLGHQSGTTTATSFCTIAIPRGAIFSSGAYPLGHTFEALACLPSSANGMDAVAGWSNQLASNFTNTNITNMLAFRINGSTVTGNHKYNSVITTTQTSFTQIWGTYYYYRMVISADGSTATFSVLSTAGNVLWTDTLAITLAVDPAVAMYASWTHKRSAGSSDLLTLRLDYMGYGDSNGYYNTFGRTP